MDHLSLEEADGASHRSHMVNTYCWGEMAQDAELKREFLEECTALDRA